MSSARGILSAAAVTAVIAAGLLTAAAPTSAATFTASNTTDSATAGSNSLRDLIQNQATNAAGDTIDLLPGATYTLDVCPPTPGGGQLAHGATPLIVTTPSGAPATIRQTCPNQRVLDQGTGALLLDNVIITGGSVVGSGGGVSSDGAVTIRSSTLTDNGASGTGGGAFASASGSLTVENSTVSANSTSNGGGGLFSDGDITVVGSTIANNLSGGGIGSGGQPITITNSTISGNSAFTGGGVFTTGPVTLVYATIVQNEATAFANVDASTLTSFGSVIALPPPGVANCLAPTTTSTGYNYSDDDQCGFGNGPGDVVSGPNPNLAALASNGGPTPTRLPQPGSRLVDAIPPAACPDGAAAITQDQRGIARPQGPGCDIGAVEVTATAPIVVPPRFTG